MIDRTCVLDGCEKPVKRPRSGLCYGHYMKQWRYGDPHFQQDFSYIDLTGSRFGALQVVEYRKAARVKTGGPSMWLCRCDCGADTVVRAGDLNAGNVTSCGDRTIHSRLDVVGYGAAHDRLRTDRGKASAHPCTDCGRQAQQWSYDHTDSDPLYLVTPRGEYPYSLDTHRYEPRCIPCHKRFDLAHLQQAA